MLVMLLADHAGPALEFQRQAIFDGQVYRLLTAHLVHTGINHSVMNLAGLVMIWFLLKGSLSQLEWWLVLLVTALCVSGGLLLFSQEVQWYRGMSGVLHGAVVLAIIRSGQLAWMIRLIILLAVAIKVGLEQTHSGLWQSEQLIGAPVIVASHLYGVVGGLVSYFILQSFRSKKMFRS